MTLTAVSRGIKSNFLLYFISHNTTHRMMMGNAFKPLSGYISRWNVAVNDYYNDEFLFFCTVEED